MAWNAPGQRGDEPPARRGLSRLLPASSRRVPLLVLVLGAWLTGSCVAVITAARPAVLLRDGVPRQVLTPGVHLKWPWPFEEVQWGAPAGMRAVAGERGTSTEAGKATTLGYEVRMSVSDALAHARVQPVVVDAYLVQAAGDAVDAQWRAGGHAPSGRLTPEALAALQQRVARAHLGVSVEAVSWQARAAEDSPVMPGRGADAAPAQVADSADSAQALAAQAAAIIEAARAANAVRLREATEDSAHFRALAEAYSRFPDATRAVVLDAALGRSASSGVEAQPQAGGGGIQPAADDAAVPPPNAAGRRVDRTVQRAVDRRVDRGAERTP